MATMSFPVACHLCSLKGISTIRLNQCSILAYFPHLFGYHNIENGKNKQFFEVFKNLVRHNTNNSMYALLHYSHKAANFVKCKKKPSGNSSRGLSVDLNYFILQSPYAQTGGSRRRAKCRRQSGCPLQRLDRFSRPKVPVAGRNAKVKSPAKQPLHHTYRK